MIWLLLAVLAQADVAREAMRQGKFEEAARLYESLARQYPEDFMIRYNVGLAYYSAKKYAPALAEMKTFLKSQPASPQGNLIAGAALLKLGQPCPSLTYFDRAKPLQGLPEYLQQRADAEAACGHPAEAAKWFELLAAKQPLNAQAWYGLGLARVAEGNEAAAQAAFQKLSALPPSPELRKLERDIARGLWQAGRYAEAKDALLRVKALGASDASLDYELGDCAEKLDGPAAALPFYQAAVLRDAKLINAQAALGRALLALQKPAEAVGPLEIAAKANIDKSLWLALANAYRALGRSEDARAALQKGR